MSAEKLDEQQQGRGRRRLLGRRSEKVVVEEVPEPVEETRGLAAPKGRATPSRRRQDEEEVQGNLLTRVRTGFVEYVLGVRSELGKVVWPTREEARRLMTIVLITLVIASIVLGLISVLFTELFTIGLRQPIILFVVIIVAVVGGFALWRANNRRAAQY